MWSLVRYSPKNASSADRYARSRGVPVESASPFATASRPPLYHDLLQLPTTAGELERQLRLDAAIDIQQERVARAGFNGSGVSRNNRLIERHVALHGAYWRTYDFEAVPQNLAERQKILTEMQKIFTDTYAYVPIDWQDATWAHNKRIMDLGVTPAGDPVLLTSTWAAS